jgi:hypothetical protein
MKKIIAKCNTGSCWEDHFVRLGSSAQKPARFSLENQIICRSYEAHFIYLRKFVGNNLGGG